MTPLLILAAVLGSALFAGLETGIVSLSRVRLRARSRRGDPYADALLRLLQRPERVLSSFLVGNTLCNVGGGALAATWMVGHFQRAFGDSPASVVAASVAATLLMSAIFLVASEVTPKVYFRLRAETAVPKFLWFIQGTIWVFFPVVWVATFILHRITGRRRKSPFVTREELRQLVRESGGELGAREHRMLQSVFEFAHTLAREVMIPLPRVTSLAESAGTEELFRLVRRHRFTRYPVYRDRVDAVVGVVNAYDVLYDPDPSPDLARYIRPLHIVPETTPIQRLLVDLQRRRESMALVVNEFGAVTGIVTVSDVVEEILGELADEHEEVRPGIERAGDGWIVEARLDIDDLNRELGLSLRKNGVDTVGGLVLRALGRIPAVGEKVEIENVELEVLAVHEYGLRRLKLRVRKGRVVES